MELGLEEYASLFTYDRSTILDRYCSIVAMLFNTETPFNHCRGLRSSFMAIRAMATTYGWKA